MVTMREFLTSGRLGEVQPGLTVEQVTRILGPADDQSVKRRPVCILRYGPVQFAFTHVPGTTDSRLVSTHIYFDCPDSVILPGLRPNDWMPSNAATEREFRAFLDSAGLQANSVATEDESSLVLDSGARIVFVDNKLHSIHASRANKADRKQMTVLLREETVERLKQRAREEHVSVHDLIEQLIEAGR